MIRLILASLLFLSTVFTIAAQDTSVYVQVSKFDPWQLNNETYGTASRYNIQATTNAACSSMPTVLDSKGIWNFTGEGFILRQTKKLTLKDTSVTLVDTTTIIVSTGKIKLVGGQIIDNVTLSKTSTGTSGGICNSCISTLRTRYEWKTPNFNEPIAWYETYSSGSFFTTQTSEECGHILFTTTNINGALSFGNADDSLLGGTVINVADSSLFDRTNTERALNSQYSSTYSTVCGEIDFLQPMTLNKIKVLAGEYNDYIGVDTLEVSNDGINYTSVTGISWKNGAWNEYQLNSPILCRYARLRSAITTGYAGEKHLAEVEYYGSKSTITSTLKKPVADVSIYPNPSEGIVHVKCSTPFNLLVSNIRGLNVHESSNKKEIDISTLSDGVYFFTINT